MSDLDSAVKEAERLYKRQKACSAKSTDVLSKLLQELSSTREAVEGTDDPVVASKALQSLHERLESQGLEKQLSDQTKELHGSVNKLGKVIKLCFSCKAPLLQAWPDACSL